MLRGIAVLLLFQLLGESMVFLTKLPIPGPVVGLILLFIAMQAGRRFQRISLEPVEKASAALLGNLGLLFVPAGVGVVSLLGILQAEAGPIAFVLFGSAVITLVITVWTFLAARRFFAGPGSE